MHVWKILIGMLLCGGLAAAWWLPRAEGVLGGYVTTLQGRTRGQRMNAVRAARAIDGAVIAPGHTWSFNRTVGSWTPDRGYVLAPVSYNGELVVDWGGGVCQTSTTVYNAALLAGLEIVERHRHTWSPGYVPPGRDAAVAQYATDLRLRNPYASPVTLRARLVGDNLGVEMLGPGAGPMAALHAEALRATAPHEVLAVDQRLAAGQRRVAVHGRPGAQVIVTRTYLHGPKTGQHELVSEDTYPAMNRLVAVGEKE